jgi:hypothetical protein
VLAEVRDGLHDAAEAHGGHPDAAERAVAEFGSVAELAPLHQAELTAAQVRRTALVVTVLFPALVLGWDLLWSHGVAWTAPAPPLVGGAGPGCRTVVGAVAAALGLGLLLATLRPRARPRRLAVATAAVGLGAAVVCGTTAVVMNRRTPRAPRACSRGTRRPSRPWCSARRPPARGGLVGPHAAPGPLNPDRSCRGCPPR